MNFELKKSTNVHFKMPKRLYLTAQKYKLRQFIKHVHLNVRVLDIACEKYN